MKNPVLLTHCDYCQSPLPSQLETRFEPAPAEPLTSQATLPSALTCGDTTTEARHGHYQILRQAGQGGMGIVYQAYDAALQRPVALKVLQLSRSGYYHQQQLLEEARVASSLQHPHIVTVHDISRTEQQSYIVTEWLEGQTLDQYQKRQLTLTEKVALLYQIASGLACAHQAGVIHRDLKPSNLMVCLPEPRVKILDFGMASRQRRLQQVAATEGAGLPPMLSSQLHSQWSQHTTAFQIKGTLPYLAPELLQSDIDATTQSDIFAFGVIMYELCYGVHPFLHQSAEDTMQAILQHQLCPPASAVQLPPALRKLITQCMAQQSSHRPGQMSSVAATLHTLHQDLLRKEKLGIWYPVLRWQLWAALAPVLLGLSLWLGQHSIDKSSLLSQGQTLALQPFDNLGGDPAVQQFLQGMALSLSQDLAKIGQLQNQMWVLPPGELASLKEPSLKNIYQQYQTDLIISGTLQHLGATRRLALNLHNGADGRILKSTELDLPLNGWDQAQQQVRRELLQLLNWQQPDELALSKGSATSDEAYKAYLTGLSYLYRFDYKDNIEKGVQQLQQAVAAAPDFTEARYALVSAYLRQARLPQTANVLEKAEAAISLLSRSEFSTDARTAALQAELSLVKSQYHDAVQQYSALLQQQPDNISARQGLAQAYMRLGDHQQAEQHLLALTDRHQHWYFLNSLALFYYETSQLDKALAIYQRLEQSSPNNNLVQQTIGAIQLSQANFSGARQTFEKALQSAPTANNYANLATVYFYMADYAAAVVNFERAVALGRERYQLWGNLADSYRWAQQPAQALAAYQQAVQLLDKRLKTAPNNPNLLLQKALFLSKSGQQNIALQHIPALTNANMKIKAAQVYELTGRRQDAIQLIKDALQDGYQFAAIESEPEFKALLSVSSKELRSKLN